MWTGTLWLSKIGKKRRAALSTTCLLEGCKAQLFSEIVAIVGMQMPYLENIHLRVQLSANDSIGQLANDFAVVPHRRVFKLHRMQLFCSRWRSCPSHPCACHHCWYWLLWCQLMVGKWSFTARTIVVASSYPCHSKLSLTSTGTRNDSCRKWCDIMWSKVRSILRHLYLLQRCTSSCEWIRNKPFAGKVVGTDCLNWSRSG